MDVKERREAILHCDRCHKEIGKIREPKVMKVVSCSKHGRYEAKVNWNPTGWDGTNQYFITMRRAG